MEVALLELTPNCECCGKALPPDAEEALVGSFECTFRRECAGRRLPGGVCPNCGGELVARPRRPAAKLVGFPASTVPLVEPHSGYASA